MFKTIMNYLKEPLAVTLKRKATIASNKEKEDNYRYLLRAIHLASLNGKFHCTCDIGNLTADAKDRLEASGFKVELIVSRFDKYRISWE